MGEAFGRKSGLRSVTPGVGGGRVRPAIGRMERGKRGERRGSLDLGQSIHPGREVGGHLSLNPSEPVGEPQVPGADRVDDQMDDRVGFDADGVQGAGCLPDELGRIHAWHEQRRPQVGERRVAGPGVPFDKPEHRSQFFQFEVDAHRMFQ